MSIAQPVELVSPNLANPGRGAGIPRMPHTCINFPNDPKTRDLDRLLTKYGY